MYSNLKLLQKRTPENGTDRESYLSLLVDEYLNSTSIDPKRQVLANLANFAYDPINYEFIRNVGVLDIFLHALKTESDEKLILFATAGICNLCLDPDNSAYILQYNGLHLLISHIKDTNTETIANIITALMYLYTEQTMSAITSPNVIEVVKSLEHSDDQRLVNLSKVFLQDVCGQE